MGLLLQKHKLTIREEKEISVEQPNPSDVESVDLPLADLFHEKELKCHFRMTKEVILGRISLEKLMPEQL